MLISEKKGFFLLIKMLLPGDIMWKIDLKDASFTVPLINNSQKYVRFQRNEIYTNFCTYVLFGLSSAPRILKKLIKTSIFLFSNLGIRILIYLHDMVLIGATLKELSMARDTRIHLLQSLGFLIKISIEPHTNFGIFRNFHSFAIMPDIFILFQI